MKKNNNSNKNSILKKALTVVLTAAVLNGLCFGFYNPLHASLHTKYRLEPNKTGIQITEGAGIPKSDSRGFVNDNLPLIEDGYVICMGSSQTVGFNVATDERYSDILNKKLGYTDKLGVYNVGYSGGKFEDMVHNFKEITEEFPNASLVVIETGPISLEMSDAKYNYAINQVSMSDLALGEKLAATETIDKLKMQLISLCPLGLLYIKQYSSWIATGNAFTVFADESSPNTENFDRCLALMRSEFDGDIVVVYHNEIDSTITEVSPESADAGSDLRLLCEKNNIDFVNLLPLFEENYIETHKLPYGFINTEPGGGHLNATGHALIAEAIYSYMGGDK